MCVCGETVRGRGRFGMGKRGLLGESGAVVRSEKGSEGSITRDMYI